jgi:predicted N-formylglutamate amidohydrolase
MTREPIIVSIHSFTPQLQGKPKRPWHLGVLSADDRRIADLLLARLEREDICVGDNEPYVGKLEGDCMTQHGINRGLPHVLIEIRNDLIADTAKEKLWAGRLAPILSDVFDAYYTKETSDG